MKSLRRYRRRPGNEVIAVRLDLDTEGFTYEKWGGTQRCKPGDWIVDNGADVYTVDRETFEATYEQVTPGVYAKHADVWARVADEAGAIRTQEGTTDYEAGDYIVFNDPEGRDGWAISREKFEQLYEPAAGSG
jgi:hypothetical protein